MQDSYLGTKFALQHFAYFVLNFYLNYWFKIISIVFFKYSKLVIQNGREQSLLIKLSNLGQYSQSKFYLITIHIFG